METKDRHEETFQVYIKLIKEKQTHSDLFFKWMLKIFEQKHTDPRVKLLSDLIPDNFPFLVSVNRASCLLLWNTFNDELKIKTTNSLEVLPKDQLFFLSKLMGMTKYSSGNRSTIVVNDDMKVNYFKLLCDFETEEKILDELKTHSYPPMLVLEICKSKNAELPIAYINERLGKSMEALEVFKTRFRRYVKRLEQSILPDTDPQNQNSSFTSSLGNINTDQQAS